MRYHLPLLALALIANSCGLAQPAPAPAFRGNGYVKCTLERCFYAVTIPASDITGLPAGSGTINSGSAFSPTYYPSDGTIVSGVTPFTGLAWWTPSAPPAVATGANLLTTFGSQSAGFVLAAPAGSPGNAVFRAIVASDIPVLNQPTSSTSGGLSGNPNISINNLQINGTCTGCPGSGSLPPSSANFQSLQVNGSGTASIITEANSQINAVQNRAIDNTGVADMSTAFAAVTTSLCSLTTPPRVYLPSGTYKANSGWHIVATSTTCGGIEIGGVGEATIIQTDCSGTTYGIWYDNTTNSGDNFKGSYIHDLTIQDTSGTGACADLLKITQVADMKIERVTLLSAKGKIYSTGTASSVGTAVTGSGTTWTSDMVHGVLQITVADTPANHVYRGEICAFVDPTHLTLCSNAFPNGDIPGGTSYAISYNGRALSCDPGNSYSQYGSIRDLRAFGSMFGIFAYGGASGGCSRWSVDGMAGHIRATPGASKVTNSEGVHLGKGSDTWEIHIPVNNVSVKYVLESAHGNLITGMVEDDNSQTPVTTCNGGAAAQACLVMAEITSESNGHGWGNSFLDSYQYLTGTMYQVDNSTGAFNLDIRADRVLGGQFLLHFYFYGSPNVTASPVGCPINASGIPALVSTLDCNHQRVAQTVN